MGKRRTDITTVTLNMMRQVIVMYVGREAVKVLEDQNKSCPRVNGERPIAASGIIRFTRGRSVGHVRSDRYVRNLRRESY